jgi:hypothetical protein
MTTKAKGDTRRSHMRFLDRMEECSYFLKPSKCQFETKSMKILGWIVGGGQVRIDPAKVKGISEWPRELTTVKQVRQILGLLGYQRLFIRGFAQIARPLHDLTKTKTSTPFQWTEECTAALNQLIEQVTSEPVLHHPNPSQPFELWADASTYALGAVLAQRDQQGKAHAVMYLSKALTAPERNYTIADKEFLAIIYALKKIRHIVKDSPHKLIIYTDHDNLRYYREPQKLDRWVARYLSFLADFDFELRHIAGTKNWADPLSRRPDHDDGKGDNEQMIALLEEVFARAVDITQIEEKVRRQQRQSTCLEEWKTTYTVEEQDGDWIKGTALVVTNPEEVRQDILAVYHDAPTAGHPGVWKTQQMLGRDYWWPTMRKDVAAYVKGCLRCQATKTITHRNEPPLIPIPPISNDPFATVAMDFITKLPPSGGCDSILTITDHDCTKAVILVPCKEAMSSEEFLELYRERAFPYTGIPKRLITDRDVRFTSELFRELCDQLAIKHNMSTAYHPQTDGQSEWTNQNVETVLRIFCNHAQDNWREWLPIVQYILNSRPSATTKFSPYELWMGKVPATHQPERPSKLAHFEGRKMQMLQARKQAHDAILAAQTLLAKKTNYHKYQKGDEVWLEARNLKTTHPTHKLRDKRFGPFRVRDVLGEVNYRLEIPRNWKIHDVFHASVLHPSTQTSINPNRYQEPPPDLIDGHEEWEVEQILASRRSGKGRTLQYLVQWKGYSDAHNSWEPSEEIHAPQLIAAFYSRYPRATQRTTTYKEERRGGELTVPSVICRRILSPSMTTHTFEGFSQALKDEIQAATPAQRALMMAVLRPHKEGDPRDKSQPDTDSTGPELVEDDPARTPPELIITVDDPPFLAPPSPSDYGIAWLFGDEDESMTAAWADPLLRYPTPERGEILQLEALAEEYAQQTRECADMTTVTWGDLPNKDREWSEGAPYVLDCTTPTYQSCGVSPVPDGHLPYGSRVMDQDPGL